MSKYNVNQIVKGKVSAIKPYGIFVKVDEMKKWLDKSESDATTVL